MKLCFSTSKLSKECVGDMHFGVGHFVLAKKNAFKVLVFFKAYWYPPFKNRFSVTGNGKINILALN